LAIAKLALFIAAAGGIRRVRNLSRLAAMARLWHDRCQPWSQTVDAEARSGKVGTGFPAKSRDQQRVWSGHGTVLFPPEVIPLQSAIRKSGLPVFL